MIIFSTQNFILLIAALVNLFMTFFVFRRGIKNKINLYFSLLTFFNFTWSLGLLISRSISDINLVGLFARSTYVSALAIVISLFYFVHHFPYQIEKLKKSYHFLILLMAIILSFFIYTKGFITETVRAYSNYEYISYYNEAGFFLYAVYFVIVAVWALCKLFRKYKLAEGVVKQQIKMLLFAIIIGLAFGSYFDLFIEYFNDYRFDWLGPIFTVLMNFIVVFFVISPKEKISN
ncbi:MAG: histidine kinase N-terminal 7TM domain-containing protein [Patescibacteria group bacterium]|jgi:hypothetical protein